MKTFRIYFEFYGRNMVTEVQAASEARAKQDVINRVKFIKVFETQTHPDDEDDEAGTVFGHLEGQILFNKLFGKLKKHNQ